MSTSPARYKASAGNDAAQLCDPLVTPACHRRQSFRTTTADCPARFLRHAAPRGLQTTTAAAAGIDLKRCVRALPLPAIRPALPGVRFLSSLLCTWMKTQVSRHACRACLCDPDSMRAEVEEERPIQRLTPCLGAASDAFRRQLNLAGACQVAVLSVRTGASGRSARLLSPRESSYHRTWKWLRERRAPRGRIRGWTWTTLRPALS
jgi:hypothetical protein